MAARVSRPGTSLSAPAPTEMNPNEPPPALEKPKKVKLTKAQKKEMKRQRDIAFKKMEMQAEFKRELELSRRTAKKLKSDWEDTLREMTLFELKQELVIWEQKAMRQLNEKDEKIQNMLTFINGLEETNQMVSARLKEFFDYMTDIYKSLTVSCKTMYEQEATKVIVEFQQALNEKHSYNNARQIHCENIMHTTNEIFERELFDDYNIFVERRNDNVNIAIKDRYGLRDGIVNKMKATKQQLLSFIQELSSTNLDPHKYERIRQLMNRQRTFYTESQRLNLLETKQRRLLSDLQRELLQFELKNQKKLNDLRLEQSYFLVIRKGIEHNIKFDRTSTFEKLTTLTSESYVVLKHLEKLRDYGELLLSIAANVRKLQTEAEKVVMWGDFTPSGNKSDIEDLRKFVLTVINPSEHVDRSDEEFYDEINLMRIFWRRLCIVETQNTMLEKEKFELLAENKKYTDFIRSMSKAIEPEKLPDTLSIKSIIPTVPECPEC